VVLGFDPAIKGEIKIRLDDEDVFSGSSDDRV